MRKVRSRNSGTSWIVVVVSVVAIVLIGVMILNAYKNTEQNTQDRFKKLKESFANMKKERFTNEKRERFANKKN